MIFLKCNKDCVVDYTHYMPFHEKHGLGKTKEQLEGEGILVDSIPEPLQKEGQVAVTYYSEEKGIYYEYEDIPKSEEDVTKQEIDTLKLENAELMFKSAMTDMELETIKNENAEILFRLATIEMGVIYNV